MLDEVQVELQMEPILHLRPHLQLLVVNPACQGVQKKSPRQSTKSVPALFEDYLEIPICCF